MRCRNIIQIYCYPIDTKIKSFAERTLSANIFTEHSDCCHQYKSNNNHNNWFCSEFRFDLIRITKVFTTAHSSVAFGEICVSTKAWIVGREKQLRVDTKLTYHELVIFLMPWQCTSSVGFTYGIVATVAMAFYGRCKIQIISISYLIQNQGNLNFLLTFKPVCFIFIGW